MSRDRSSEDMSWAVRLANQGHDEHSIAQVLKRSPRGREAYSPKYLALLNDRGKGVADAYAERTARNAVEFVSANPQIRDRSEGIMRIVQSREAADRVCWSSDPGARRALEAAFLIAFRVGSVRFGLSLREHALIAGQSFKQIRLERARLDDLGWLHRDPKDRAGRTSRFTLKHGSAPGAHSKLYGKGTFTHTGLRCECALHHQMGELALRPRRTPRSKADLDTHFRALAHDVYRGRDDFWYVASIVPPSPRLLASSDEGARLRGTVGALEATRAVFEQERAAFRGQGIQVVRTVHVIGAAQEVEA